LPVSIGVDTGGTYTDAVLFDSTQGVLRSAKALTTRHDLALGIREVIGAVLNVPGRRVSFVSVSTTLATNALAERKGAPICILLLGYPDRALHHTIVQQGFGTDPVLRLQGGHTVDGDEQQPLDLESVRRAAKEYAGRVRAFAVSGYFSVRNPTHENTVREMLTELTGHPISCGHELSSRLHAGRRAMTTAWNARLLPLLSELVAAVRRVMTDQGLSCPLLIVKGDGSLLSAETAPLYAVQTILSGPAASVVGARYLSGLNDCCVVDIGGTTTDIAFVRSGRPVVSPDGARVGGLRTMTKAVRMHTFALGGDSIVTLSGDGRITFGPMRVVPVSLALHRHTEALAELEHNAGAARTADLDGDSTALYMVSASHDIWAPERSNAAAKLSPSQLQLVRTISGGVVTRSRLLAETASVYRLARDLKRLVQREILIRSGFTPSDAAHILGYQRSWNRAAAVLAAVCLYYQARTRAPGLFKDVPEESHEAIARTVALRVHAAFVSASARAIVAATLCETTGADIAPDAPVSRALVDAAVQPDDWPGLSSLLLQPTLALKTPLVAVGAPAGCYYREAAGLLHAQALVPQHSEVANAIGAVVGEVSTTVTLRITPLNGGEVFRLHTPSGTEDYASLKDAEAQAAARARVLVEDRARMNGAATCEVNVCGERVTSMVAEGQMLIESLISAEAIGRPQA